MNKSYKSIWNESLGTYVAAAEGITSGGRKTSSTRKAKRSPERAGSGASQLALEPRIVFDAAVVATIVDTHESSDQDTSVTEVVNVDDVTSVEPVAASSSTDESTDTAVAEPVASDASANDGTDNSADSTADGAAAEHADSSDAQVENASTDDPAADDTAAEHSSDAVASDELAISEVDTVDQVVERVEIIFVDAVAADIVDDLSSHPGEIYVLDADRDGVEQIAEILN